MHTHLDLHWWCGALILRGYYCRSMCRDWTDSDGRMQWKWYKLTYNFIVKILCNRKGFINCCILAYTKHQGLEQKWTWCHDTIGVVDQYRKQWQTIKCINCKEFHERLTKPGFDWYVIKGICNCFNLHTSSIIWTQFLQTIKGATHNFTKTCTSG